MTDHHLDRLDLLLLARLATAGRRPPTPTKLESELFAFVEARLARREWSSQCAQRLQSLQARGWLDDRRTPTPAALEHLREALGVQRLPGQWKEIWQALVPAITLQLPASRWSEIATADKLRARLIREHYGLGIPPTPTLTEAVDAQAWQELGLDRANKLGEKDVKLALMQQALGIPVRTLTEAVNAYCWTLLGEPPQVDFSLLELRRVLLQRTQGAVLRTPKLDARKVGERLATDAAGTTTGGIDVIRRALVGRWIFEQASARPDTTEAHGSTQAATSEPASLERPARSPSATVPSATVPSATVPSATVSSATVPSASEPASLERWAARVQAVADATSTGRYGDQRVFIAAVWRATQADSDGLHAPLPDFKTRLVEANRAGLLRLHRADLVGAMDAALVRESETHHLNATFHFIEIQSQRTP